MEQPLENRVLRYWTARAPSFGSTRSGGLRGARTWRTGSCSSPSTTTRSATWACSIKTTVLRPGVSGCSETCPFDFYGISALTEKQS